LATRLGDRRVDVIAGIESRGFLFAAALALKLGVGLIPLRKPDKLPHSKVRESYSLEYGKDALEMHEDAIRRGDRIALVDDLLATGGTVSAACRLRGRWGGAGGALLLLLQLARPRGPA